MAALLVALYTLIGRTVRMRLATLCYISYVYSIAATVTLPLALAVESPIARAYSVMDVLATLALAVVPTVFGHGLYNYALRYVKAIIANLFPLLEPLLASVFALVLFAEIPSTLQVGGYALIALGVITVAMRRPS